MLFARKADGSLCMYVDYRALNQQMVENKYPLLQIDDLLDRLAHANVISSINL